MDELKDQYKAVCAALPLALAGKYDVYGREGGCIAALPPKKQWPFFVSGIRRI
jgi:hypothetical protein